MPIHDWSRVGDGIFHDFHNAWIIEIRNALNGGVLPPDYYALAQQTRVRPVKEMNGSVLIEEELVVYQSRNDHVVALVEIVTPGNKTNRLALKTFVEKAVEAIYCGYHLLVLDLQPPGLWDIQGIHRALWAELGDDAYTAPPDKPLTLVTYLGGQVKEAFVEPVAVGDALPNMPLFLEPEAYVPVPLEATYQAAWRGVPQRWRRILERVP